MATAVDASFATKIREEFLACPICHSQFSKPKVLQCQHSFCAKCLKGWLQTKTSRSNIECAVCRKKTRLSSGGIDDLPENYVLKGMISIMQQQEKKKATPKRDKATTSKTQKQTSTPSTGGSTSKTTKQKNKSTINVGEAAKPKAKSVRSINLGKTTGKSEQNTSKAKPTGKPVVQKSKTTTKNVASKSNIVASRIDRNSNIARHVAKSMLPVDMESDSSEDCSYSSDSSEDSEIYDNELTIGSDSSNCDSDEDSDVSDDDDSDMSDDSDVPPTPTLKTFGGFKVGMEVYVFNRKGKRYPGILKMLEKIRHGHRKNTYAGIEMNKEMPKLIRGDIEDSYLNHWLQCHPMPCIVVPVEDCVPRALVDTFVTSD